MSHGQEWTKALSGTHDDILLNCLVGHKQQHSGLSESVNDRQALIYWDTLTWSCD